MMTMVVMMMIMMMISFHPGATIAAFGAGVLINNMIPQELKDELWGKADGRDGK